MILLKNVRSWRHGPHATIDQRLGFPLIWVWMCFAKSLASWCCATETHRERNVRSYEHGPHATIGQHLGFR